MSQCSTQTIINKQFGLLNTKHSQQCDMCDIATLRHVKHTTTVNIGTCRVVDSQPEGRELPVDFAGN